MSIYAEPRIVNNLDDCLFYHTMYLPGLGKIEGSWDLNPNIKTYLGNVDFKNKRVFDVGCASGMLSFYIEQQGAEVVSFDLDKNGDWDVIPYAKWTSIDQFSIERKILIDKLNNSYWFSHRYFGSKAKVVYGNVYAIPDIIGNFDISVYGAILLHLRDPFLALQNGLRITRNTIIISDVFRLRSNNGHQPYLGFIPDPATIEPKETWWDIRPGWVQRAIGVLGFEDSEIYYHTQKYIEKEYECFTVVGRRTHGIVR